MIIFVDIDDTICYYAEIGNNKNYDLAEPYKERINKINKLYDEGNTIIYWTARGTLTQINWFEKTLLQLKKWNCKFNELRMGKPVYDLFIDDKNINSDTYFNKI
jgi:hypothetical protein